MIKIYNRKTKEYDIEKVAGDKYLKWVYTSPVGKSLTELFIKKKLFSRLYGLYCDTSFSAKKVDAFIRDFDIDMSLCEPPAGKYSSFNEFFIRKLSKESRPIDKNKDILISPGDGRLLAFTNIDLDNLVQIKGLTYSLKELLKDDKTAMEYEGGTCLILRLCPTDYHRFHFVDDGICGETKKIKGRYYSVNPIALEKIPKLFCENKREWSIFKSENFGDIIHVEVGATCVGTIVQSYTPFEKVSKGDEKGYFKFGGSTTILFFKKDAVNIHKDIVYQTSLGYETKVIMGETIGNK
ncbi:phosphatidylserine decarboxylase [Clostridium polynesiense]|uniref:phosphatidylserine decarboxylase n=1 Tax=Clostridium polynesiense TaxID=1325933 RepID=UPI00058D14BB|nr:phosphatidylserine decarboxylase [Clostridium polynesiense]